MKRITKISSAALLAIFASTAFVATADARGQDHWCQKNLPSYLRLTHNCDDPTKVRRIRKVRPPVRTPGTPTRRQNFSSAPIENLAEGGGDGSNGGGGGAATGGGGRSGSGAKP